MVYDAQVKQIILFGGNPVISKEKDYNGPMWSWDGHVWNSMNSKVPLVFNSCLAYSTDENFILRFGGWNGTQRNNDTWMFRHHDWEKLTPENSPPARNHSIMVYQQESKSFILFGGHDGDYVFGDIWEFKNGKWNLVIMVDPRMRLDNGH